MGRTNGAEWNQSHHDEQYEDKSPHQQQEDEEIPEQTQVYPPQNPAQIRPTYYEPPVPPQPQPQPVYGQTQPVYGQTQPVFTKRWSSGLFDCMNDPNNALVTLCFPCVTFGQIAEIVDQGQTPCMTSGMFYFLFSIVILPFFYSSTYRSKIRVKHGLVEESGPDCLVHFCCEHCALCQEYRELQAQGLDPSIGWIANVHHRQQQMNMMPPSQQRMQG